MTFICGGDVNMRWLVLNAAPHKILIFRAHEVIDAFMFKPPHNLIAKLIGPTVELEMKELVALADFHEALEAKRRVDRQADQWQWGRPNTRRIKCKEVGVMHT